MSDLKWQVKMLRELLAESERRLNEQEEADEPSFQLWSPCVAKTRYGEKVLVWRIGHCGDSHCYQRQEDSMSVKQDGHYYGGTESEEDVVEVVRLLTEKEILDFQMRGIKPLDV